MASTWLDPLTLCERIVGFRMCRSRALFAGSQADISPAAVLKLIKYQVGQQLVSVTIATISHLKLLYH